MILTTFDPGFDCTGWATFDLPELPRTLQGIVSGLVDCGQFETRPIHGDSWRMAALGKHVHYILTTRNPDAVAVEMPAYHGNYGNDRSRRASVNKLYMAIGAILSQTSGENVFTLRALTTPKEQRHELLENAARIAGIELPTGPRGGKHEDAWDAVFLGCQVVMDRGASLFAPTQRNTVHPNERAVG